MSFFKDFKSFIFRGNILDLAIAVIIGAAFGTIISSLVEDVITPILLHPALEAAKVQDLEQLTWGSIKYGKFLSSVITFLIIAMVLFTLLKTLSSFRKKQEAAESGPSSTDKLLMEIRDALKKQ